MNLVLVFRPSVNDNKVLDLELRGDFPRVSRHEPKRSRRNLFPPITRTRVHKVTSLQLSRHQLKAAKSNGIAEGESVVRGDGKQ